MKDKEGSRDISLGPYRSTKLKLEDKLNGKESKKLADLVESKRFGLFQPDNFNLKQIIEMVSALGYQKKADNLFVNNSGRFIYISCIEKSGNAYGNMRLVSGNYYANLEELLDGIDIIAEMEDCHNKKLGKEKGFRSEIPAVSALSGGISIPILIHYLGISDIFAALGGIAGFIIGFAVSTVPGYIAYNSKMRETASFLSMDVSNYSFGKKVYDQIISDYFELTRSELPEAALFELPESSLERRGLKNKLESSEMKQLPEKKEWAKNQIGPETFVVSEETVKYFEKPESERGLETAPAFKGPALLGKGRDKK